MKKLQIIAPIIYLAFVAWWASFQHVVTKEGASVQWFSSTYGVMALIGSLIGFAAAKRWGGLSTVLGKSLTLFSVGLLAQEAGQLIYAYYIYVDKIQIPYPSWGDVAYFGSVLLYIAAIWMLAKAMGAKYSLKNNRYKILAVIVPLALLITSFTVLLHNHQYDTSHPLTVFLDFGYPMGQAIYVSIAIVAFLLARKTLGGVVRKGILLVLLALLVQYASDSAFIYQNSRETYYSGGVVDLLYLTAYFAMVMALLKFEVIYQSLQVNRGGADKPASKDAA